MRLFLSSSDPQGAPAELRRFVGDNPSCALIVNANDAESSEFRDALLARVTSYLGRAGFDVDEMDLRDFDDDPIAVRDRLAHAGLVWAHGGNAFVLRAAMRQSGFETQISDLLSSGGLTYGGCSAGAIVAGTSLRGVELVDPISELAKVGGGEPIWTGLGLCEFAIAPHFGTPGAMGQGIDTLVSRLDADRLPYRALRDGESIQIDGQTTTHIDHSNAARLFFANCASH